jgi:hypothetical protein
MKESLSRSVMELCEEVVRRCGEEYKFDASEAMKKVGMCEKGWLVVGKEVLKKKEKSVFPLPYNGEYEEGRCEALRYNNGLYTQCEMEKKDGEYCKSCKRNAEKNGGVPEYGKMEDRKRCGMNEYVDPKGRKQVCYVKVMKKYNKSEEEVREEGKRQGIEIDESHFVVSEKGRRGRPVCSKEKKEKKEKGRPKKSKKVLEIEGEEEDLFAKLVANADPLLENPLLGAPLLEKVEQNMEANPLLGNPLLEKVEQTVEAKVEQTVEAKVEQTVEAKVEQTVEAKVKQTVEAKVEQTVEAKVEQTVEAKVEQTV